MNIDTTQLEARCAQLQDALRGVAPGGSLPPALIRAAIDLARDALKASRSGLAVPILEVLVALAPREAGAWQVLGFAYGEEQHIPEAVRAFSQAATLNPDDPLTDFGLAQSSLDAGFPAAALFARVR